MAAKVLPLMPADVEAEIDEATRARDELIERIAAGQRVTPGDLAAAEDAVRMAELRTDLGERNAAAAREAERVAEVDRIALALRSTNANGPKAQAARIAGLYSKAVETLTELAREVDEFTTGNRATLQKLRTLQPMPPGIDVGRPERRFALNSTLTVDGVRWPDDRDFVTYLVAGAAYEAVQSLGGRLLNGSYGANLRGAAHRNGSLQIDRIIRCAEEA